MIINLLVERERPELLAALSGALRSFYKAENVTEENRIGLRTIWTSENTGRVETVRAIELGIKLADGQKWNVQELGEKVKRIMRAHGLGALVVNFGNYSEEFRV